MYCHFLIATTFIWLVESDPSGFLFLAHHWCYCLPCWESLTPLCQEHLTIQRVPLWSGNKFTPKTETILFSGQIWGITKTRHIYFRTSNPFQKCGTTIVNMCYVLRNPVRSQWEKDRYDPHFIAEAAEVLESEELVQSEKTDGHSYVTISGSTVTSNATILGIPPLAEHFKLSI